MKPKQQFKHIILKQIVHQASWLGISSSNLVFRSINSVHEKRRSKCSGKIGPIFLPEKNMKPK